ncbi:MAG: hypothetical protein MI717_11435 [Spirochaetales bacterium]|nr:hypothetical protein [Spirochaetales bacterium]
MNVSVQEPSSAIQPHGLTKAEQCFAALAMMISGVILLGMALLGPLWNGPLHYATSPSGMAQLLGQDVANLFIGPLLVWGGIQLLQKKERGQILMGMAPLYLLYYGLSVGIGMEWGRYEGNSHHAFPALLFLIISGVLLIPATLTEFRSHKLRPFHRRFLWIYGSILSLFLLLFSLMWLGEVFEVLRTGSSRGYAESPVVFWVIRYFDLGITIPLAFFSFYVLATRPGQGLGLQLLCYGFFLGMALSVNAMGFSMLWNQDGDFQWGGQIIFIILALIVFSGYGALRRGMK